MRQSASGIKAAVALFCVIILWILIYCINFTRFDERSARLALLSEYNGRFGSDSPPVRELQTEPAQAIYKQDIEGAFDYQIGNFSIMHANQRFSYHPDVLSLLRYKSSGYFYRSCWGEWKCKIDLVVSID